LRLLAAAAALLGAAASLRASEPDFLSPGRGESLAPGSVVTVHWRSACESDIPVGFDEAELVLSLDGGLTYPIRVSGELDPCESSATWRVPALASGTVRLALRAGDEEGWSSEKIIGFSEPFQILPDAENRVETLVPRSGEWGVAPEPEIADARDLLGKSMRGAGERLTAPFELAAFSLPAPAAGPRPDRRASALAVTPVSGRRPSSSVPTAPSGAPIPLRL
jgi:hypothetical protein